MMDEVWNIYFYKTEYLSSAWLNLFFVFTIMFSHQVVQ